MSNTTPFRSPDSRRDTDASDILTQRPQLLEAALSCLMRAVQKAAEQPIISVPLHGVVQKAADAAQANGWTPETAAVAMDSQPAAGTPLASVHDLTAAREARRISDADQGLTSRVDEIQALTAAAEAARDGITRSLSDAA
jgi:hypothetical protein